MVTVVKAGLLTVMLDGYGDAFPLSLIVIAPKLLKTTSFDCGLTSFCLPCAETVEGLQIAIAETAATIQMAAKITRILTLYNIVSSLLIQKSIAVIKLTPTTQRSFR